MILQKYQIFVHIMCFVGRQIIYISCFILVFNIMLLSQNIKKLLHGVSPGCFSLQKFFVAKQNATSPENIVNCLIELKN